MSSFPLSGSQCFLSDKPVFPLWPKSAESDRKPSVYVLHLYSSLWAGIPL